MIASRHYTVEQANAALDWVQERIARLREAREGLSDEEARAALGDAAPTNGGGAPGRVVSEAFLEMRTALVELQEMEVVLRDLDRGLIDFPSIRDGQEVFLCWEEGEGEVAFWHELDAGVRGSSFLTDQGKARCSPVDALPPHRPFLPTRLELALPPVELTLL